MSKPGSCWKCKKPITDGNFLNIAGMDYHAACFECVRCMTNVYGKNFSPSGEPGTLDWKIFCTRCDPYNDSDLQFEDQRAENEKKNKPLPLPREAQKKPDVTSSAPSEPIVSEGHVRALAQIGEAKRQDKERQERFEDMQKKERQEAGERRQRDIEVAKKMKNLSLQEEQDAEKEIRRLRDANEKEEQKKREEVKRREEERRAQGLEVKAQTMTYREEIPEAVPEPKRQIGKLSADAFAPVAAVVESTSPRPAPGKVNLDAFAAPPSPPSGAGAKAMSPRAAAPPKASAKPAATEDRGALLGSIQGFNAQKLRPAAAAPSDGSAPPPPPPSAALKKAPAGAPPASEDRGALLNSIQGFSAGKLRSTQTNDRSAPSTNAGGGGGEGLRSPRSPRQGGGGDMGSIAAMAAAAAAARR